jgi:hypothetical protein
MKQFFRSFMRLITSRRRRHDTLALVKDQLDFLRAGYELQETAYNADLTRRVSASMAANAATDSRQRYTAAQLELEKRDV